MAYTDLDTVFNTAAGLVPTAAYFDQIRTNEEQTQNEPCVRVYSTAAISIGTSSETALTFTTARFDPTTMWVVGSPSRLTVAKAGVYQITAHVAFAANVTGIREVKIRLNGSTAIATDSRNATSAFETRFSPTALYKLAATDYVDVAVFQSSGGNLNVQASGNFSPEFSMVWVSKG